MNSDARYVGFWLRFLAFIIDSVLVSVLLAPLALTTNLDYAALGTLPPDDVLQQLQQALFDTTLQAALTGLLFVGFWIFLASTPGKLLFRGYIVNAADLRKASRKQLIIRYLGYFVSMLPFFLGFVWIAFDGKKQGWHDKMAGTVVVFQKPEPEDQPVD